MATATWNGATLAKSDQTEVLEGNHYFPANSIRREFFQSSDTTSVCGWKGTAHYFHVIVNGQKNADAAWYYPEPKPEAAHIADYVAFWKTWK